MKKTVTIALNKVMFHIEEQAYEILNEYLDSIKTRFNSSGDAEEILADMESSIAEKFSDKISSKEQVIIKADVEELIKVMGTVDDIEDEADPEVSSSQKTSSTEASIKKLYRNSDDVIIAGVCSGLATYVGIDPIIIRLIFILSVFLGGAGVVAYLILWLVMPEAKTGAQKLEMQGTPVTLKKLEEHIREKIKATSQTSGGDIKRILSLPIQFIGAAFDALKVFFRNLFPVLAAIIGTVLVITMIFAIFGITFAASVLIFNIDSPYLVSDLPLNEFAQLLPYELTLVSLYTVLIIPVIFLLIISLALAKRKNIFNTITNSILIGIWMLAIITIGTISIDAAPQIEMKISEYSESLDAEAKVRIIDAEDFDTIYSGWSNEVNLTYGEEYKVTVTGREDDLNKLEFNVVDNELIINKKHYNSYCIFCFSNSVVIDIELPELVELDLSGASKSTVSGFESEEFSLNLSGASKSDIDMNVDDITIDISGASKLTLVGQAKNVVAEASGASKIYAFGFSSKNIELDLSGASKAEVNVSDSLNIDASGASIIYVYGDPTIESSLSGSSRVYEIEDEDLPSANVDEILNIDLD
jgi:phage shock protein PspC (stress-responsive transcriptional regulator)